jgi:hypothetical protein
MLNLRACYNSRILRYLLFHCSGRRQRRTLTQSKPSLTTLVDGNRKPAGSDMARRHAESRRHADPLHPFRVFRSFRGQIVFLSGCGFAAWREIPRSCWQRTNAPAAWWGVFCRSRGRNRKSVNHETLETHEKKAKAEIRQGEGPDGTRYAIARRVDRRRGLPGRFVRSINSIVCCFSFVCFECFVVNVLFFP